MKHHCSKKTEEKLRVKDLCVKHAKIKNLSVENDFNVKGNASLKNVTTNNLIVTESGSFNDLVANEVITDYATINDLQVKILNGKNLSCEQSFQNKNSPVVTTNPLEYPKDSTFDKKVWDGLVAETLRQKAELAERLQCGRLQLRFIQREFGCVPCPPDELDDCFPECDPPAPPGEVCDCPVPFGECPSVPLEIFGIESVSPINEIICGPSQEERSTQLVSSISYNLDVTNISGTLATRVVTVLVQAGYLDENGDFVYREIDFGNRQFGATLDTAYGEKYTGTVVLDTGFMQQISTYPNSNPIVQLIIFKEDGVAIDVKGQSASSKRGINSKAEPIVTNGPIDTSYLGKSVGGQLQWANIYSRYTIQQDELTQMVSNFKFEQSSRDTQWVMGWQFKGASTETGGAGGYFGVNTGSDGTFQILGSIFNVADSAQPAEDYVSAVRFGGEGVGWSLRITRENISNFPIELNKNYTIQLLREEEITDDKATWKFSIVNIDDDKTLTLGTIKTPEAWKFIDQAGIYQFSEYYGPGEPTTTCPTIPLSIIEWSYPRLNQNVTTYEKWSPPPQHCGEFKIVADPDNETVVMSYGQGANQ